MKQAKLILDDGSEFQGWSFGYDTCAEGEVVFNTAMTGYPESLTDPSYEGQILVMTYPLIGNYGVPSQATDSTGLPLFMESDRIHVSALVVADYSERFSHYLACESLGAWLRREHIPAITGIDTRRLTMRLREHGVMGGKVVTDPTPFQVEEKKTDPHNQSVAHSEGVRAVAPSEVERVSTKEVVIYKPRGEARHRVVLVDCGVKANIIRLLLSRGMEVVRVPWDYDFNAIDFDGLFLANGPGDPTRCGQTVEHIRQFMQSPTVKPCMGICLGNQLLALAAGATTYKLKYGHRSHNQPVRQVGTNRLYITSQNHGYAVDDSTLPRDWEPLFVNMNDGSNEGIRHKSRPWFSVQFHPEACAGPEDTEFLFDEFVKLLDKSQV